MQPIESASTSQLPQWFTNLSQEQREILQTTVFLHVDDSCSAIRLMERVFTSLGNTTCKSYEIPNNRQAALMETADQICRTLADWGVAPAKLIILMDFNFRYSTAVDDYQQKFNGADLANELKKRIPDIQIIGFTSEPTNSGITSAFKMAGVTKVAGKPEFQQEMAKFMPLLARSVIQE